jgi:hypothetical protein
MLPHRLCCRIVYAAASLQKQRRWEPFLSCVVEIWTASANQHGHASTIANSHGMLPGGACGSNTIGIVPASVYAGSKRFHSGITVR